LSCENLRLEFSANFYSSPEGIALSSTARVNAAQSVHSQRRKNFLQAKKEEFGKRTVGCRSGWGTARQPSRQTKARGLRNQMQLRFGFPPRRRQSSATKAHSPQKKI